MRHALRLLEREQQTARPQGVNDGLRSDLVLDALLDDLDPQVAAKRQRVDPIQDPNAGAAASWPEDEDFDTWLADLQGATVAELDFWAASRNWGARRKQDLDAYVHQHYATYPVTRQLCMLWSDVTLEARKKGRVLRSADAWIAATAIRLNAPLMTNNVKDFAFLSGVQVISPPTP